MQPTHYTTMCVPIKLIHYLLRQLEPSTSSKINICGFECKVRSQRIVLFATKGIECVSCGVKGEYYTIDVDTDYVTKKVTTHLNLRTYSGELMTKDHIVPKSKGGPNRLHNYQTMCATCNHRKGDKHE